MVILLGLAKAPLEGKKAKYLVQKTGVKNPLGIVADSVRKLMLILHTNANNTTYTSLGESTHTLLAPMGSWHTRTPRRLRGAAHTHTHQGCGGEHAHTQHTGLVITNAYELLLLPNITTTRH